MPRAGQLALVLVAVAVVVAVFLLVRPSDEQTIDTGPAAPATTEREEPRSTDTATRKPDREPRNAGGVPLVRVVDGEPKGGPLEIEARRGDAVAFEVESDSPDEVHVHGYELYEDVEPDRPAAFEFDADLEGIYEVELHGAGTQIAELRVSP